MEKRKAKEDAIEYRKYQEELRKMVQDTMKEKLEQEKFEKLEKNWLDVQHNKAKKK